MKKEKKREEGSGSFRKALSFQERASGPKQRLCSIR
jgi:hypothetical protein